MPLLLLWAGPSSSSMASKMDFRRRRDSCARAMYFSRPRVQYFFPFFPRPFSSTLLMILRVFSRKLSKSSFWYQRSFLSPVSVVAAVMVMTKGSSRNEQLFMEEDDPTDWKESDKDAVEEQEPLRSYRECVECDEPSGSAPREDLRCILDVVRRDGISYDNDGDGALEQEALLSLFLATRRGRCEDSAA